MARAGGPLAAAAAGLRGAAMAVSGAAVVGMMALVTFEVLLRTFANRSTLVADEMAGYLLVAMTFLGLAPSLRAAYQLFHLRLALVGQDFAPVDPDLDADATVGRMGFGSRKINIRAQSV